MADSLSGREQVRRRAEQAKVLSLKFNAEAMGLFWAMDYSEPISYSSDPDVQAAFVRGMTDGRELLKATGEGRS
jgi:hypothetical protein